MAFEIIETNDLNEEKNKGSLLSGILSFVFLLYLYFGFAFETLKIFYPKIIMPEKIISFFVFSSEINFGVSLKYFFPR